MALVALVVAAPAADAAPPPPPGCGLSTTAPADVNGTDVPITDGSTVTSTIAVTGSGPVLDVDVVTSIVHPNPGDLLVTLRSPSGTVVTLSSKNGGDTANVFDNTRWNDDADDGNGDNGQVPYDFNPDLVTDRDYPNESPSEAFFLVPEEPLAAFVDEPAAGTWTLTIHDDTTGNEGTLQSWALAIELSPGGPLASPSDFSEHTNDTDVPIGPGPSVATSDIVVSGDGTYLSHLDLPVDITHTYNADLDITLTSPEGTIVTLTSDNGFSKANIFNPVFWTDDADPGSQVPYAGNPLITTDYPYTTGVSPGALTPEEALGAFIGEDPNGTWTLRISDDLGGDEGTLKSWTLNLRTTTCRDMETKLEVDRDPATVGGDLTYTVRARNRSPNTALSDPSVSLPLPAGITFTDVGVPTGWACSVPGVGSGGTVSCTKDSGSLGDNESVVIPVSVKPTASAVGVVTATATGTASGDDLQSNDESTVVSTVVPAPSNPANPGAQNPGPQNPQSPQSPQIPTLAGLASSAFTLTPSTFLAKPRGASIGRARRRPPFGTRIGYRLSIPASARFTVEKALPGRRVGRRCVAQTRTNRTRPPCTRFVALRGSFTHSGRAGANSLRFSGRLNGAKLAPGKYRLTLTASASGGRRAPPLRRLFTIAR